VNDPRRDERGTAQVSPHRFQLLGRELPLLRLLELARGGEIPPDELAVTPDEQFVPATLPFSAAAVQGQPEDRAPGREHRRLQG